MYSLGRRRQLTKLQSELKATVQLGTVLRHLTEMSRDVNVGIDTMGDVLAGTHVISMKQEHHDSFSYCLIRWLARNFCKVL